MNAAMLIATRELRDRSRLFLIAAAMAVVPFFAALTVREHRSLAIATVTAFLATAYSSALALALGVSSVGREMTEKRLSFFFAKPVSAASIWAGKVAAGLLTVFGALAVIVLPTYLFAHRGWTSIWTTGGNAIIAYAALSGTVLFFAGHTASTMLRSRSARVGIDFALMVIAALTLFAFMRPILMGGGLDVVLGMLLAIGCAVLLLLALAPVWQLSRGRVDARGNHAALSTAIWSGVAVIVLAAGAYARWVISPSLNRIADPYAVEQSQSGRWVYLSGQTPGRGSYVAAFLVDTTNGHRERLPIPAWAGVHFSANDNMIAWLEPADLLPTGGSFRLHTRRLEPGAKQVATPVIGSMPRGACISADGARIAMVRGRQLEVYETESGRLLGVTRGIDGTRVLAMMFAGPDVVRVVEETAKMLQVREFDVAHRKLITPIERKLPAGYVGPRLTADGSRIYVRHERAILDAHSGNTVAVLPLAPDRPFFSTMLRDGSAIVTRDSKLYHFDPTGKLLAEIPLPLPQAGVAGEIGSSKVLLVIPSMKTGERGMLVVDLAARKVAHRIDGIFGPLPDWNEPVLRQYPEDATFVGLDSSRHLVLWDARTGAKRPFPS